LIESAIVGNVSVFFLYHEVSGIDVDLYPYLYPYPYRDLYLYPYLSDLDHDPCPALFLRDAMAKVPLEFSGRGLGRCDWAENRYSFVDIR
jgi:hypothetical protein